MEHTTDTGLVAVYRSASTQRIDRELRQIDPQLFLDPEFDQRYGLFYTVKYWNGERAPNPVTVVVDWREPNGQPKDLSDGILYEVQRIRERGPIDVDSIIRRNEELKRKREDAAEQAYEDQSKEAVRWLRTKPVFHRSAAYAVAKRRTRARGLEWG